VATTRAPAPGQHHASPVRAASRGSSTDAMGGRGLRDYFRITITRKPTSRLKESRQANLCQTTTIVATCHSQWEPESSATRPQLSHPTRTHLTAITPATGTLLFLKSPQRSQ
jgi:hypothetical protein